MTALTAINVVLALAWVAVTGSLSLPNLVFGFVLGAVLIAFVRGRSDEAGTFRRGWRLVSLALFFLIELWKSGVRVIRLVLQPRIDLKPGIIAYPLTVRRDGEIALLANLITLTPGTLSVDVSDDKRLLFVHCVDVPDTAAAIEDIRSGFERRILEAFR